MEHHPVLHTGSPRNVDWTDGRGRYGDGTKRECVRPIIDKGAPSEYGNKEEGRSRDNALLRHASFMHRFNFEEKVAGAPVWRFSSVKEGCQCSPTLETPFSDGW